MDDIVCIIWYGDETDLEIRTREEWMEAPSRNIQVLTVRSKIGGQILDDATGGPKKNSWGKFGTGWYVWWPHQDEPWGCDPDGLRDYLTVMGVMTDNQSLADLTFKQIEAAGAKMGRSIDQQLFHDIIEKAFNDPRLPRSGRRV